MGTKLELPTVTLCAATSVNVEATVAALTACLEQIAFADCLLLTDAEVTPPSDKIRVVPIEKLFSSRDYSAFILNRLADHIHTMHCLVVQWDGYVLNVESWDSTFLLYDYVGAPWPQFDDEFSVGNGGFSLRSRKLLLACRDSEFCKSHPEDLAICRINRPLLESRHGIRFADKETAERFAFERSSTGQPTFGFHGIFNMLPLLGADRFWKLYRTLDDRSSAFVDFQELWRQFGGGSSALQRRARMTFDRLMNLFRS